MVYPYYGIEEDHAHMGGGDTRKLGKRELEKEVIGSKVYLEIDNRQCVQNSNDCFSRTDLAASYLAAEYLKADLPYPIFAVSSFTGALCMENIDDCIPKRCHHGVCKDGIATFTCECFPGYMGRICSEQVKECYSDPCQNGGHCVDLVNGYQCNYSLFLSASVPQAHTVCCATLGWITVPLSPAFTEGVSRNKTGQLCTDDVDECRLQPNTCQNGGTCSNTVGGYSCVCVNGWSGLDCSENIDDCALHPCLTGVCQDRVASFFCSCPFGKTGLLCHVDDACISNPCRAGSQCDTNPVNGKFNCNCPSGYKGNTCNDDIDECTIGEGRRHTLNSVLLCHTAAQVRLPSHLPTVPDPSSGLVSALASPAPS
ncbi:hypothetical protein P4O66_022669 [Electrophorus voltai]|uniref:EGF-like domain-containing protein n=1 Tax=Electrophorus voltai TaxID=2609070 RepID=A0AAD8ZKP1_9TELE|nr:hypothetical protein P4O66_022669 [Electrophorus voltai]